MILRLFIFLFFILNVNTAWGATYYVRNDGSTATNCTGLADAAYDGSGTGEACAWRSLATALPRTGALISGGDTVIIDNVDRVGSGQAQYEIGYNGADIVHDGTCFNGADYDCTMSAIPAGTLGNETKIYGKGYASCSTMTVSEKAQLWGSSRVKTVLIGSNYVDIRCLDITDHDNCMQSGPDEDIIRCDRDCTGGVCDGADTGLDVSNATGVIIQDVDIHGLFRGIMTYRSGDITATRFNVVANSFVGWDSDLTGDDSMTGHVILDNSKIIFNGCGEDYPITNTNFLNTEDKHHCYSQDQGGFGDGIGLGDGTPGDWTFRNNSMVSWNTSDGVDLLHGDGTGTVIFNRSKAEGNAGQAFKSSVKDTFVENSEIFGNCGYFYGQSFTATKNTSGTTTAFNNCRANGDTIAFSNIVAGQTFYIKNSTILSNGDSMLLSSGSNCNGSTVFKVDNSILYGGRQWGDDHGFNGLGGNDTTDLYYASGSDGNGTGSCGSLAIDIDNSMVYATKNIGSDTDCSGGTSNTCGTDPLFSGTIKQGPSSGDGVATDYFQALDYGDQIGLQSGSSARDDADETVSCNGDCTVDYNDFSRSVSWDIGALEYGSAPGGGGSLTKTVTFGGVSINLGAGKIIL